MPPIDAFIKAYGGPYILGQQEGKLKLIKGAPHVPLTAKICRGHNVVYELVHATKPPEPGFNTLIFGLNLRRSGFHYHQDTIASLKAKNGESPHCILKLHFSHMLTLSQFSINISLHKPKRPSLASNQLLPRYITRSQMKIMAKSLYSGSPC